MNSFKEPALIEVVSKLIDDLDHIDFEFVDYWDSDNTATGLVKRGDRTKLIYISIYDEGIDYYCEFEVGDVEYEDRRETVQTFEHINYFEMLEKIRMFLIN